MAIYAYDPTVPLPTLVEVEDEEGTPGDDVVGRYLAEHYPAVIYFEYVAPPSVRDQVRTEVADFLATIADPTQALDIAVHDLTLALNDLAGQEG